MSGLCGSANTWLVILRGNSGSGKSTAAAQVRLAFPRGVALVGQDHVRRIVLREHDQPHALNIDLIDTVVRFALDHGRPTVLEGILYSGHYSDILTQLSRDHRGATHCFYLDVDLDETLRRHATRPLAAEVSAEQMRGWYTPRDLITALNEQVIDADSTLERTVERIVGVLPPPD